MGIPPQTGVPQPLFPLALRDPYFLSRPANPSSIFPFCLLFFSLFRMRACRGFPFGDRFFPPLPPWCGGRDLWFRSIPPPILCMPGTLLCYSEFTLFFSPRGPGGRVRVVLWASPFFLDCLDSVGPPANFCGNRAPCATRVLSISFAAPPPSTCNWWDQCPSLTFLSRREGQGPPIPMGIFFFSALSDGNFLTPPF